MLSSGIALGLSSQSCAPNPPGSSWGFCRYSHLLALSLSKVKARSNALDNVSPPAIKRTLDSAENGVVFHFFTGHDVASTHFTIAGIFGSELGEQTFLFQHAECSVKGTLAHRSTTTEYTHAKGSNMIRIGIKSMAPSPFSNNTPNESPCIIKAAS